MENDKLKAKLMESYGCLNIRQVLMILAWGIFAPRKTKRYVERIKQGMNAKFAYREAKNVC